MLDAGATTVWETENGEDNLGGDKKDSEPIKKKGCGSDLATDALAAFVVLLAITGVIHVICKTAKKAH